MKRLDYRNANGNKKDTRTTLTPTDKKSARPVVTVDYERYAHFLEDSDFSEEQKQEFLQAIWQIVVEFVSLGFGVHPLQQVGKNCGKGEKFSLKPALTNADTVYLDQSILKKFIDASDLVTGTDAEGV